MFYLVLGYRTTRGGHHNRPYTQAELNQAAGLLDGRVIAVDWKGGLILGAVIEHSCNDHVNSTLEDVVAAAVAAIKK